MSNTNDTIASMVARTVDTVAVGPKANTTPDMRYDGETGQVTVLSNAPTATRISDSPNHDPMSELAQVDAGITRLEAQLAEETFDPQTGAPSPKLTGHARELVEIQLATARNTHHYQALRAATLYGQREADVAAEQQAKMEQAARFAYTQGNPAREAALNEALARAEADAAAAAIVASRRR